MFFLLLIAIAVVALTGHGPLAWSLLIGFIGVTGYNWLASTATQGKLSAKIVLPEFNIFAGEEAEAVLTLENSMRLPILWLYLRQDLPPGLEVEGDLDGPRVISMFGLEKREYKFKLSSLKRGIYRFGDLVLETGDLFGIWKLRWEVGHDRSLVVYPVVHDLSRFRTASRMPFGRPNSPKTLTEDPSWVRGVRDYIPGDPMSRIHWKASSHAGRLQTKEIEPAITLDCAIILNLDKEGYPARYADALLELGLETAASLVAELLTRRCSCQLYTTMAKALARTGKTSQELPWFLEFMAGLSSDHASISLSELVKAGAASLGMGGIVYIITPSIDDALVNSAYGLLAMGRCPVILHLCPRERVQSRMAGLSRASIQYVRVQRGLAAHSLELLVSSAYGPSGEVSGQ